VWASFFALPPDQYQFHGPEELVGFLSRMAYNKVVDVARRRFGTLKANVNREQPLAWEADRPEEVPVQQATPSQEVMAEERWQLLIANLEPPYRQALEMLRLGHTHNEVAEQTGLHPKLLQRWLQRLTARWGTP
jgi:DNA-directed RNA polymerase specialized sigma24 family protein